MIIYKLKRGKEPNRGIFCRHILPIGCGFGRVFFGAFGLWEMINKD